MATIEAGLHGEVFHGNKNMLNHSSLLGHMVDEEDTSCQSQEIKIGDGSCKHVVKANVSANSREGNAQDRETTERKARAVNVYQGCKGLRGE